MHFFIPFWMFHATSVTLILESIHRARLVFFNSPCLELTSRFKLYIKRILCGFGLQRWKHALRAPHKRAGPHRLHSPGMQIEFSLHAIDHNVQRALQRFATRLSNDQLQHSRPTRFLESFLVGDDSNAAAGEQDLIALLRSVRDSLDFAAFTGRQSGKRQLCNFTDRRLDLRILSQPASCSSGGSLAPICLVFPPCLVVVFRYPADYIYQVLPDLLVNLPFASHPSLLAPAARLLLFLLSHQLVSATIILSFLYHRIAELSALGEAASIRCVEAISPLAGQLILLDTSQLRTLLSVFHCLDETTEKRVRLDGVSGDDAIAIPENSSIWVFFFLLKVMNSLVIHLNHKSQPFFPSTDISLLESLRSALIQHFSRVILPPHSILKPSTSPIASSLPLTLPHLVVCLEVCLTQLLENEKEMRRRLMQYILQSLNTPLSDSAERKSDLCTVFFDGSSNSLRLLTFPPSSSLRVSSTELSLSSFSLSDLMLVLTALLPSLLFGCWLGLTRSDENQQMEDALVKTLASAFISLHNKCSVE